MVGLQKMCSSNPSVSKGGRDLLALRADEYVWRKWVPVCALRRCIGLFCSWRQAKKIHFEKNSNPCPFVRYTPHQEGRGCRRFGHSRSLLPKEVLCTWTKGTFSKRRLAGVTVSIPYHTVCLGLEVAFQSGHCFSHIPLILCGSRNRLCPSELTKKMWVLKLLKLLKAAAARPKTTAKTKDFYKIRLTRAYSVPQRGKPLHRCPLLPHGSAAGSARHPLPLPKLNIALSWSAPVTAAFPSRGAALVGSVSGVGTAPPRPRVGPHAPAAPEGLELATPGPQR